MRTDSLAPPSPPVSPTTYRVVRALVFLVLTGVVVAGLLGRIPRMNILEESARNLYFHVPMWFTTMAAFFVAAYHGARYLGSGDPLRDIRSAAAARVGLVFGLLGMVTGIVWARFTWYVGTDVWWNSDPKQLMAAVQLLIYGGYFVLRSSIDDEDKRGRLGAAYLLFAAATTPFLLYVLPRQFESLHPGAEGTPAFSQTDLAPSMRWVFYPAVVGFIGLFWVLYVQRVRAVVVRRRLDPTPEL